MVQVRHYGYANEVCRTHTIQNKTYDEVDFRFLLHSCIVVGPIH